LIVKIETIREADCTVIRLIGRLEAEYLSELKGQIRAGEGSIVFEMDELTFVDLHTVRFFIECERRGVELRGCPAYIREWIAREQETQR
jgi:hypothetical protein